MWRWLKMRRARVLRISSEGSGRGQHSLHGMLVCLQREGPAQPTWEILRGQCKDIGHFSACGDPRLQDEGEYAVACKRC